MPVVKQKQNYKKLVMGMKEKCFEIRQNCIQSSKPITAFQAFQRKFFRHELENFYSKLMLEKINRKQYELLIKEFNVLLEKAKNLDLL